MGVPNDKIKVSRQEEVRYFFFGRIIPATFFALLAPFNLRHLVSDARALGPHPSVESILSVVHTGLYLAFVCIPIFIYIGRPRARARDASILAGVLAFTGTFMLLIFPLDHKSGPSLAVFPEWLRIGAHVLLVASTALAIWCLAELRSNFSITPEARQLQRHGPYRFVRHPLYAAEIGAAASVVLGSNPRLYSVLILVALVVVQFGRTVLEERLLRENFAEYKDYARTTPRFVPHLMKNRSPATRAGSTSRGDWPEHSPARVEGAPVLTGRQTTEPSERSRRPETQHAS